MPTAGRVLEATTVSWVVCSAPLVALGLVRNSAKVSKATTIRTGATMGATTDAMIMAAIKEIMVVATAAALVATVAAQAATAAMTVLKASVAEALQALVVAVAVQEAQEAQVSVVTISAAIARATVGAVAGESFATDPIRLCKSIR